MKLAFAGAHSVGKSTLVNIIRDYPVLANYGVYDGLGRKILKKNWSIKNKQRYFNWWYAINHAYHDDFISARTIYDTQAHSKIMIDPWFNTRLFNWAIKYIYYDYVFYIPPEFPIEDDGGRYTDPDLQFRLDKETKLIMDSNHIPYHTITGSIEERTNQVRNILGL